MTEKNFELRTIMLSNGLICYEFDRVVLNDSDNDILSFRLKYYACDEPKKIFIDEIVYFNRINNLDDYIDRKISEFKDKGFK